MVQLGSHLFFIDLMLKIVIPTVATQLGIRTFMTPIIACIMQDTATHILKTDPEAATAFLPSPSTKLEAAL
jgi:hypothetical protein